MRSCHCSAEATRAVIARLGQAADEDPELGRIHLRPHQVDAVGRLREMIDRDGGALLADEAGLGKTYVALAIARRAAAPLVIAPAALRPMWLEAMEATGVRAAFVSYERLSRGQKGGVHDFVVLDEAHHARNAATRRYGAIADLSAHATVLLLSATPLHNRRRDLQSLLALFLGERSATMDDAELERHVYRRERGSVELGLQLPEVIAPVTVALPHDDGLLEALVALPPPLPPADGGDGGALLVHALVRQWASSDGALRAALDRRAARAGALIDALSTGRLPTRSELRAWTFGDGAVQLAFPELMASDAGSKGESLLHVVQAHAEAVNALRRVLRERPALDAERARRIREIRRKHDGEKIVAFTSYADTASALYHELRVDAGVAMLAARGGRVAGGSLTRRETVGRFAPAAQGVAPPSDAERIDLLLATDLLSEGMNLQDASVVIHLDMPWTPARLEQRVGRAARLGSAHSRVAVYALAPPASAERLIAVERRLREKLALARASIGNSAAILPPPSGNPGEAPDETLPAEVARRTLARWRHWPVPGDGEGCTAAVRAPDDGFLAAVRTAERVTIVAGLRSNVFPRPEAGPARSSANVTTPATQDAVCYQRMRDYGMVDCGPELVAAVIRNAEGPQCRVDPDAESAARAAIAGWAAERRGAAAAGAGAEEPLRRRVLQRIVDIVRRAPLHRRTTLGALAAKARLAVSAPLGAGAERRLMEIAASRLADDDWLAEVARWGGGRTVRPGTGREASVVGLLLLQRGRAVQ